MDQPVSGGDAEIVVFDSRLHSQSSTRRYIVSPYKRGELEDIPSDVKVEMLSVPDVPMMPSVEAASDSWKMELGLSFEMTFYRMCGRASASNLIR